MAYFFNTEHILKNLLVVEWIAISTMFGINKYDDFFKRHEKAARAVKGKNTNGYIDVLSLILARQIIAYIVL